MGERKFRQKSTTDFLLAHPLCCLCGGTVPATTVEHAPPKIFFVKGLPSNSHRVPACARCNHGSSQADQICALIALTMAIHKPLDETYVTKLINGVRNNSPAALRMILKDDIPDVPIRVDGAVSLYAHPKVDPQLFTNWLNPWAAKQAYALHYLHKGVPISEGARVFVQWFTNANVINEDSPDELLQKLRNYGDLRQGNKTSELEYSYKYQFDQEISCIILMLHDSSMVMLGIFDKLVSTDGFPESLMFTTNPQKGIHQLITSFEP